MKFYLDEDLSPQIAERLRQRGLDALSAMEAGNLQLSDREQLAFAAAARRALVTRNARHFVVLAQEAIARQEPHAGILLCSPRRPGSEIRTVADALARVAARFPRGLGPYDVLYV